eukprot:2929866-Rhodomonas_salina.1
MAVSSAFLHNSCVPMCLFLSPRWSLQQQHPTRVWSYQYTQQYRHWAAIAEQWERGGGGGGGGVEEVKWVIVETNGGIGNQLLMAVQLLVCRYNAASISLSRSNYLGTMLPQSRYYATIFLLLCSYHLATTIVETNGGNKLLMALQGLIVAIRTNRAL